MRGSVPVHSLNLREDILEIFSGVSKKPDTETNLLVSDAKVANLAKPFQFGHQTHQSLSLQNTKFSNTCQVVTRDYSLLHIDINF